jgi:glycosyltransferase involved in cell wall biosynthesis
MKNFRFNYIITIHNKQDLIKQVLEGVIASCRENSFIYPVIDGCTDNTEMVIDEVIRQHPKMAIIKVHMPDVFEIKAINAGIRAASQKERGCNIILQDDVIIQEPDLENLVYKIYEHLGYENVGYLTFRHGVNLYLKDRPEISEYFRKRKKIIEERDLIESAYGTWMSPVPLRPHMLVERMATVGSPQCLSFEVIKRIGVMDEQMAPCFWFCHDISLRCLAAGLHNYVFGLHFRSDIDWGTSRVKLLSGWDEVFQRNREYLYQKHKDFLIKFSKSKECFRLKLARPFTIPGIPRPRREDRQAVEEYYQRRLRGVGLRTQLIDKYIKLPLKRILTVLRLY